MYLTKSTYIGAEYEHRGISGTIQIAKEGKEIPIQFNRVSYIRESVGYWTKANQIHAWFVQNVQGGEDDCEEYRVSKKDVLKMLSLCKQVKESPDKAPELLPVKGEPFFGSTEYQEDYFEDIESTIKILESILSESSPENENFEFDLYYSSSW